MVGFSLYDDLPPANGQTDKLQAPSGWSVSEQEQKLKGKEDSSKEQDMQKDLQETNISPEVEQKNKHNQSIQPLKARAPLPTLAFQPTKLLQKTPGGTSRNVYAMTSKLITSNNEYDPSIPNDYSQLRKRMIEEKTRTKTVVSPQPSPVALQSSSSSTPRYQQQRQAFKATSSSSQYKTHSSFREPPKVGRFAIQGKTPSIDPNIDGVPLNATPTIKPSTTPIHDPNAPQTGDEAYLRRLQMSRSRSG